MWSESSSGEDALKDGKGIFTMTDDQMKQLWDDYDEVSKITFASGAMEEMSKRIGNKAGNVDIAKDFTTPNMRKKLSRMMGDKQSKRFYDMLKREQNFTKTEKATGVQPQVAIAGGNALGAYRREVGGASSFALKNPDVSAGYGVSAFVRAILDKTVGPHFTKGSDLTNAYLAKMMTQRTPSAFEALLPPAANT